MQQVDVIVNGAGPVGLLCAFILMKNGYSVYLADKKTGPTDQSRAFAISPRTLEILQHYGLAYRVLQEALSVRGAALFVNGTNVSLSPLSLSLTLSIEIDALIILTPPSFFF